MMLLECRCKFPQELFSPTFIPLQAWEQLSANVGL